MKRRQFWNILLVTVVVWLGCVMSEDGDYPMELKVEWSGIDTSRYVVTHADTILPISVKSNCFRAIRRYFTARNASFQIYTQSDTTVRVGKALYDEIISQLGFVGVGDVYSAKETLQYSVSERVGKPFVPQIRDVDFHFEGLVGLSGSAVIDPDTVWLYGSPASLAKIDELHTAPTSIEHITDSGYYTLALDPTWKEYGDLRISTDVVRIHLPVEHFAEIKLQVPVKFRSPNQHKHVRLYPEQVEVTLWVPSKDYKNINVSQLEAVADSQGAAGDQLPVLITRFPANTRIKQVSPATIQYVIIK